MNKISDYTIDRNLSIFDALKMMDKRKSKLLIVTDESLYSSMISIGDIQRAIISSIDLSESLYKVLRKEVKVALHSEDIEQVKNKMFLQRNEFMPVIDDAKNILDVVFWKDLFETDEINESVDINLPVVIMAGGKGTRLRPLTNVLPKPLIPIGEQTMLEDIMDRFKDVGCRKFLLSVNYKADFIKLYFDSVSDKNYEIEYFQENKPLGTAGSLHLISDKIKTTFFISNCDIIIDEDYSEILKYHRESGNEITCVAAIQDFSVPYGVFETKEQGLLKSIIEKPNYASKINTGLYILEPHLLSEIPKDEFYHITTLIQKLCDNNRKVGIFPVSSGSWIDIGNWDEYIKYISG